VTTDAAASTLALSVGRFTAVPEQIACYDTDVQTAATALGMAPEDVTGLVAAGLPHRSAAGGEPLFDYDDLMNVGMFSGTGRTVPEIGLRFLMRFAASSPHSWYEPRDWQVGVRPTTALWEGHGDEPVRVMVRVPDGQAPGVEVLDSDVTIVDDGRAVDGWSATVRLTGAANQVHDPAVKEVWESIVDPLCQRQVIYQTVPELLRADHRQAWDLGIADCVVASRLLADRLRQLGHQARVRRGYLLGLFGSDHAWCELVEDGVAKALDPVFAFVGRTGDRARGVPATPRFAEACFGGRFNRLLPCVGEEGAPLSYFGDRPAPYWSMSGVTARPSERA
jgi:hypothetical protein